MKEENMDTMFERVKLLQREMDHEFPREIYGRPIRFNDESGLRPVFRGMLDEIKEKRITDATVNYAFTKARDDGLNDFETLVMLASLLFSLKESLQKALEYHVKSYGPVSPNSAEEK